MFKINLVPEVQEKKIELEKMNLFTNIGAGVALGILVTAILIVNGVQLAKQASLNNTNTDIASLNEEVSTYKELEETVLSLENGLAGVKQIADGENSWTKLLPHIEKVTPADAKLTSLKLSTGAIEANVETGSVDSLAKMIEALKKYQVIALSGTGDQGAKLNVLMDGLPVETVKVKSTERWNGAVSFDPTVDHEILVKSEDGSKTTTIKYIANDKTIAADDSGVLAESKYLFTNVETNQYQKNDKGGVTFSIKLNFDEKAIW